MKFKVKRNKFDFNFNNNEKEAATFPDLNVSLHYYLE